MSTQSARKFAYISGRIDGLAAEIIEIKKALDDTIGVSSGSDDALRAVVEDINARLRELEVKERKRRTGK